jgi:CRISPR-associated protein Cas5d
MQSSTLYLKIWGPLGLFGVPGTSANQFSYPICPPTAAEGIISAIYKKPAIDINILNLKLLSIPSYHTVKVNEFKNKPNLKSPLNSDHSPRNQNNKTYLVNPAFVIAFNFQMSKTFDWSRELGELGNEGACLQKHVDIFKRRVSKFTPFQTPSLGNSECVMQYKLTDCNEKAVPFTTYLGKLPKKFIFTDGKISDTIWTEPLIIENGFVKF